MLLTFCVPTLVNFLEDFEGVRAAFPCLGVPEQSPFRANVIVDEVSDGWTESLFLIATDPNQEPVGWLQARGKSGAETSTSANSDAPFVDRRCVGDTSELFGESLIGSRSDVIVYAYLELTSPDVGWHIVYQSTSEVTLNTANEVVVLGIHTLADCTECVVFLDSRSGDTSEQALLHATFEAEDRDLGGRNFDVDGNLANEEPWESDKDRNAQREPECLGVEDQTGRQVVPVFFWVPQVPENCEDPSSDDAEPTDESVDSFEDTRKDVNDREVNFRDCLTYGGCCARMGMQPPEQWRPQPS
jgi:hypothetical protein